MFVAILATAAAPVAKHLLYIVFDDLRPELGAYGVAGMQTPHLDNLAATGLRFDRAYAQESVCSPSRASFSTGRRPNSTQVWNFLNHWRQSSCTTHNNVRLVGDVMPGGWVGVPSGWQTVNFGGAAQCCTSCSAPENAGCAGWSFENGNCTLLSAVHSREACPTDPAEAAETCVSGEPGVTPTWTPLPQRLREHGYLVMGSGKYYHDGSHAIGAPGDWTRPAGAGQPPMADAPLSWSNATDASGTSVQWPDIPALRQSLGYFTNTYGEKAGTYLAPDDEEGCNSTTYASERSHQFCVASAAMPNGSGVADALCDYVTYHDAVRKLRFAAANFRKTGQPFAQVTGIRRPHLKWRTPQAYEDLYPAASVAPPLHKTLDASVDPLAYSVFGMDAEGSGDFVTDPYSPGNDSQLVELRRHYKAAISWADYAAGRVLSALDDEGLTSTTLTVMHSDHGWHLGEYAMWEKRTLWELSTRVPFVVRAPWIAASVGASSRALVELVDIYPTVLDLLGVPLPTGDSVPVDGTSLRPLLEDPKAKGKALALSTFPRCAHKGMPPYGARGLKGGAGKPRHSPASSRRPARPRLSRANTRTQTILASRWSALRSHTWAIRSARTATGTPSGSRGTARPSRPRGRCAFELRSSTIMTATTAPGPTRTATRT